MAHMKMVKQTQRLPLFAKAIQLSGLDAAEGVVSQQEQEIARKEAELQSIYGSENEIEMAPQAQFAPRMQLSEASSQAANEAAALFFDDEPKAPTPQSVPEEIDDLMQMTSTERTTKPSASGIDLPASSEPPITEEKKVEHAEKPHGTDENVNLLKELVPIVHSNSKFQCQLALWKRLLSVHRAPQSNSSSARNTNENSVPFNQNGDGFRYKFLNL